MSAGDEIRTIVDAHTMLPDATQVPSDYKFYDELCNKIEQHFKNLTDKSMCIVSFRQAKQEKKESSSEYEIRLRDLGIKFKNLTQLFN